MKKMLILIFILTASVVHSESTPTPTPLLPGKWIAAKVPWDLWFKDNTIVTDKIEYVHFFWNANDFKANFEVKDKEAHLADAAVYLVKKLFPADAKADLVKVDIVYVLERDSYGVPKWDSLQQVLHVEFLRSKVMAGKKLPNFSVKSPEKVFDKFQIF
ncbi:MAG TPA: hypothetical protein VN963_01840 [bacterium]|nr:hypothetical protein [bacterium]